MLTASVEITPLPRVDVATSSEIRPFRQGIEPMLGSAGQETAQTGSLALRRLAAIARRNPDRWLPARPRAMAPVPQPLDPGLRALSDLDVPYRGVDPGLYGEGRNQPPPEVAEAAEAAASRIQPLDQSGAPSSSGQIGLVILGPSTTMLQAQVFERLVGQDPRINPRLRVVNGGQDSMVAQSWARPGGPWRVLAARLARSGVAPTQVQVAWIKAGHLFPFRDGGFPLHAERYANLLSAIARQARAAFPNLQIAYLSSEVYFGFSRNPILPEPYAFEGAFGVRSAILRQAGGDPALNADPDRGQVVAPVLLWGPYLWSRPDLPRSDGLIWTRADYQPDGVHPSALGSPKVAGMLHQFLLDHPSSQPWYLG